MSMNNLGMGFHVSAVDNASPALESVSNKLGKTDKAAKKAKVSFEDIGGKAKDVGTKMQLVGGAALAGLGLAAHEAAKFEFGVAQVATEADKAKLPMSAINDIAKKMALQYGGDLDTQVKALYQGVAAGADDAAKATALLDGANRLAIAGNTDQATAILGITKVLNNYGMTFDKATDVADAFFVAVKNGQTTVGELGDAIGQVAALGKNAGASMEELIGALGTAATLGKDTASSAASLKAALSGIAHPTADAAAEAARLGIKFDSVTLRSKGLVGFLKSITSSSKFTADSMNKLFGSVEASGFMSALVSNDMSALNSMMEGMKNKAGGAEEAFQTMSATMQQQAMVLKANVQVALVDLGDALMPFIKTVGSLVTKMVKAFTALPAPVKKAIALGLALGAVLLVVVGTLLTAGAAIAGVVAGGEVLAIAVAAMVGLLAQWAVGLGLVIAVGYLFKRAFDENLGGFGDLVKGVAFKVKLAFDALSQVFTSGAFSGEVMKELGKAENSGIKAFAIQAFLWFNRIKNFFEGIGTGFESALRSMAPAFAQLVKAVKEIGKALGFAQDGPEEAARAFSDFGKMGERVGGIIGAVAAVIVDVFTGIAQAVKSAIEVFGFMRKAAGTGLGPALMSLFDSFIRLGEALGIVSKNGTSTGEGWKILGGVIGFVIGGIVAGITALVNVISTIVAVVAAVVGGVIQMFQGLWNFFAGFIEIIWGIFTGDWAMVWDGAKRMVFGFVQFVMGLFNTLAGGIFAIVDKIMGAFGKTSNLAGDLKKETDSILNSTQQGLGLTNAAGGQDRRTTPVQDDANKAANGGAPVVSPIPGSTAMPGSPNARFEAAQAANRPGSAARASGVSGLTIARFVESANGRSRRAMAGYAPTSCAAR